MYQNGHYYSAPLNGVRLDPSRQPHAEERPRDRDFLSLRPHRRPQVQARTRPQAPPPPPPMTDRDYLSLRPHRPRVSPVRTPPPPQPPQPTTDRDYLALRPHRRRQASAAASPSSQRATSTRSDNSDLLALRPLHNAAHTAANATSEARQAHPPALPATTACQPHEPSLGVAVIGCQSGRNAKQLEEEWAMVRKIVDLLELVPPRAEAAFHRASSAGSGANEEALDGHGESAGNHRDLAVIVSPIENMESIDERLFTDTPTANVGSGDGVDEPNSDSARRVLNRDYIVFTDEFAAAHPELYVSKIIRNFQETFSGVDTTFRPSSACRGVRRQRLEVIHYTELAEKELRPLFRLRSGSGVYGCAEYAQATGT